MTPLLTLHHGSHLAVEKPSKVFNTLQLWFDGLVDRREAIKRLQYEKPNCQYCFRSQAIIGRHLKFKKAEVMQ
jgi:hypothetical protein